MVNYYWLQQQEQPPNNDLHRQPESLLNPATDLPLPRRLSIRRRCSSRLSAATTSFESFNEMNMLSQVNMSGLRAATDENREKSRRFLWVFLLTICFAVMVVGFRSITLLAARVLSHFFRRKSRIEYATFYPSRSVFRSRLPETTASSILPSPFAIR